MGLSKKKYLEFHRQYFEAKNAVGRDYCEILDHDKYGEIEGVKYLGPEMRVVCDIKTGINELLNWINQFTITIRDLEVWSEILDRIEDDGDRLDVVFEIVYPVAFMTLSFPAAIKSKLAFTTARSIRDLYKLKRRNGGVLGDHDLTEKQLKNLTHRVEDDAVKGLLNCFLEKLQELDNDIFRVATMNYRNRANHQIAPYIEVGERMSFAPLSGRGFEGFSFGIESAIKLRDLLEPLKGEHHRCCLAYRAFWECATEILSRLRLYPL